MATVVVGAAGAEGRVVIGVDGATPIEADNQPGGDDHARHREDLPPVPLVTSLLIRHMAMRLPLCSHSASNSALVLHRIPPFQAMTSCPNGPPVTPWVLYPAVGGAGFVGRIPWSGWPGPIPLVRPRSDGFSIERRVEWVVSLRPGCGSRARGPGLCSPRSPRVSGRATARHRRVESGASRGGRTFSGGDGPSKDDGAVPED